MGTETEQDQKGRLCAKMEATWMSWKLRCSLFLLFYLHQCGAFLQSLAEHNSCTYNFLTNNAGICRYQGIDYISPSSFDMRRKRYFASLEEGEFLPIHEYDSGWTGKAGTRWSSVSEGKTVA